MTDIISKDSPSAGPAAEKADRDADAAPSSLIDLIELFFFAYRDFTKDPDVILEEFAFGRAHHRVLHFVNRYPGLRVADLLDILKITKQSLSRVLKQLVESDIIEQRPGKTDRRERRLFATARGQKLAIRLMEPQLLRMSNALTLSGTESQEISKKILYNMIDPAEHAAIEALFKRSRS